ncbi:glycoside hydrolase superfamily [Ilyonectria robusta]|uniref:glycoside hydrolase superfamily n=1 Tax=Ilyonectria robusta TaxID=1079257 RepID=UPI001E8EC09A|nr:glycoside hydrolase superfamily [Ilyonectria robusta]KAH8658548.1 glycoside hydrolase superfamily [Ilyonectria robusta]
MLLGLLFAVPALARDLGQKPQMGWNSWNSFKNNVSEQLIKDTAKALVDTGLKKLGYNFVVIDGGWQAFDRDENERQQPNATKFPNGIKTVGDEIHDLGLKFGIYSDAGIFDCGFSPGSYGYEELDAQTYADWGVDYLKYDNCGGFQANTLSVQERFLRMSHALKATGREIFYSLCEWGHQFPWFWADQFSESYRMSGDIHSAYRKDGSGMCTTAYCLNTGYAGVSVLTMIRKMRELSRFQKPGSWADMDMLEVGTYGMTEYQEQTHFAFWAALKSPLIIGADITNITDNSLSILKNKEIIAINQDELGAAVNYLPSLSEEGKYQIWAGPLSSGKSRYVVLVQNYGNEAVNASISISDIAELEKLAGQSKLRIRDVWDKKDLGRLGKTITLDNIEVDQVKVLVLSKA